MVSNYEFVTFPLVSSDMSSFAIISIRQRERKKKKELLSFSFKGLAVVFCVFPLMLPVGLWSVIAAFPDHNHLFLYLHADVKWASSQENLSSGFPPKRVSNQSPQLQETS